MEWTTLLQKAIDYMEAHMTGKINYEDVAGQVNMSAIISTGPSASWRV